MIRAYAADVTIAVGDVVLLESTLRAGLWGFPRLVLEVKPQSLLVVRIRDGRPDEHERPDLVRKHRVVLVCGSIEAGERVSHEATIARRAMEEEEAAMRKRHGAYRAAVKDAVTRDKPAPSLEEAVFPQFPTALRKMWSGGEVQEWINENWKKS